MQQPGRGRRLRQAGTPGRLGVESLDLAAPCSLCGDVSQHQYRMTSDPTQYISLTESDLLAQRRAHARLRREGFALCLVLVAILVTLVGPWGVVERLVTAALPWPPLILFGSLVALLLLVSWRQWRLLVDTQLECPHGRARLATRARIYPSPPTTCPSCGKVAIAPVAQLKAGSLGPRSVPPATAGSGGGDAG